MKKITVIIFMLLCGVSCQRQKVSVTNWSDYQAFLSPSMATAQHSTDTEMTFWENRLLENINDEASVIKLAALYAERFKASGLVKDIVTSDSLYTRILKNYPDGSVDIYHALAANAITQHKFRTAYRYAESALALKDKKATSLLILTDAALELGNYARAVETLREFRNKHSFAYLIRQAKLQDHAGNLDTAIVMMEKAHSRVKGNKSLAQWTLTNLADMYGHAGRVHDAYRTYLKVLEQNPSNDYALKGIAWIALSHDHNTVESKTIVKTLAARKKMPEAYLMLAEIAEMNGDEKEKKNCLKVFKSMVEQPGYKTMYHKYLAVIEADEFHNADACINIAREEIRNRPVPQSYDLLAWGYYHQKDYAKALDLIRNNVENRTFEPDAYYHMGMIYAASGDPRQAKKYLRDALESGFELGPSVCKKIKETLLTL